MRKKIAAANWKMNLTLQQGQQLLNDILALPHTLAAHQQVIFGIPFPYLYMAAETLKDKQNVYVAAQNCYTKKAGAFTGETSVDMISSVGGTHVIIGHSERREYFNESNQILAEKINICLAHQLTPVFCCGEPLQIREAGTQNDYVGTQLKESLYHLTDTELTQIVIAYEPIWAIGTGKTASAVQAQEMHLYIRNELSKQYGNAIANDMSILYGGSVNAANANELFAMPDVDGGLVGGASLKALDFNAIINALA